METKTETETRGWIEGVFCDENEMRRLAERRHYLINHNKTHKNDIKIKEIEKQLERIRLV
jgi:hypothetical protein